MAEFLGYRIASGALEYSYAIERRPDLKEGIDAYLIANGHEELIVK